MSTLDEPFLLPLTKSIVKLAQLTHFEPTIVLKNQVVLTNFHININY